MGTYEKTKRTTMNIAENYRRLTDQEIARLRLQGCKAEDWSLIEIHPDTDLQQIEYVDFSGTNRIGTFRRTFTFTGGVTRHAGIRHATLHDTTVGDDCLIEHVHDYIAHYDIAPECVILHTSLLAMTGRSAFGNGVELSVMSESGGREIIMHDRLSAPEAYLQAMHRHNPPFTQNLRKMAAGYAESQSSERGHIGRQTRIVHCGSLQDIKTGPCATLDGVTSLENGTISSRPEAPTFVGHGVIARNFIFQAGSHISDRAQLTCCHVGEASTIGHGFTASDTYFACNCQAENGEACAVLAGPYTVTHHKSTLLIGGMFSFMNAGSATNQSNHAYKLGPARHGVLERGCKTASGTHISWPVRVGAFSLVMGHCEPFIDSHELPFSYIVQGEGGANYVIPGIALRNVGTLRDIRKWPERDGRPAGVPRLDPIVFDAFSPYVMERVLQGYALLSGFGNRWSDNAQEIEWNGLRIKRRHAEAGRELYRMAIDRFFGEQLLKRLERLNAPLPQDLYSALRPAAPCDGRWCDVGGLTVPKEEVDRLEGDIANGGMTHIEELGSRLQAMQDGYEELAWAWTWGRLLETYPETTPDNFVATLCLPVIRKWADAASGLGRQTIADAYKEFVMPSHCAFGIDGDETEAEADRQAVLGTPDRQPLIQELEKQLTRIQEKADGWLQKINRL